MNQTHCIYFIETPDGIYIGSTDKFERRKRQHMHLLRKGKHHSAKLQQSFCLHGVAKFSIVEFCDSDSVIESEQRWIDSEKGARLLNASFFAKNPMRSEAIRNKWTLNLSDEERTRRSDQIKKIRKRPDFKEKLKAGMQSFYDNGGRQIMAEKCRSNVNRIKAASIMMMERWKDEGYRLKMKKVSTIALGRKISCTRISDGAKFVYDSVNEAAVQITGNKQSNANIRSALNGKQKTAYGYKHEYIK